MHKYLHTSKDKTHTQAQTETLQLSLERAAGGRVIHVNADKTEYMSLNQSGDISTLKGGSLTQVDKIIYLGSSVSSNENDINT